MARRGENIYKRKDGRYEGRYIKGYNSNGKAIYGYVYAYAYTKVRQKLALCKATVDPNKNYSQLALSQWLYCWLNIRQEIKQTTMQVYRGHIYNHIIPAIGHIPLNKLNSETIQRFVSSLQLSPSTVRVIYTVIKKALCCAAERGYMPYICSNIKLPRKKQE